MPASHPFGQTPRYRLRVAGCNVDALGSESQRPSRSHRLHRLRFGTQDLWRGCSASGWVVVPFGLTRRWSSKTRSSALGRLSLLPFSRPFQGRPTHALICRPGRRGLPARLGNCRHELASWKPWPAITPRPITLLQAGDHRRRDPKSGRRLATDLFAPRAKAVLGRASAMFIPTD